MACQFTGNDIFFLYNDPLGIEAFREPHKGLTSIPFPFDESFQQEIRRRKR